jgi:hypothetical protein
MSFSVFARLKSKSRVPIWDLSPRGAGGEIQQETMMSGVARAAAVIAVLFGLAGMASGLSLAGASAMGAAPGQQVAVR